MMKEQSKIELFQIQQYMMQMRPILKREAIFSDGTADYRDPVEPEQNQEVKVRFRTAKQNVDAVWIRTEQEKRLMKKVETDENFDYYEVRVLVGENPFYYYFELQSGAMVCFYDRFGVTKEVREQYRFCILPGFHTPDWAKGAVMYQILVDRFCNGDTSSDVQNDEYFYIQEHSRKVDDWDQVPANFDVTEFYGGDLQGVLDKLDYLQNLGVEVIYFNPLFVSPSSHKYDIQDYDSIDPHYGTIPADGGELLPQGCNDNKQATKFIQRVTAKENLDASNALFAKVVEEAHKRGMRVILDGVFNHCGSFNKWLDKERIYENAPGYEKGAYVAAESPYHNFFHFTRPQEGWPYNNSYEGWWGFDTLPKLNYEESKELHDYIMRIGQKWVSPPYNADGWRLDVAADLGHSAEYNHKFWSDFRRAVKVANPDAVILAEHYGDPRDWLRGDQWDTVMNYDAFMEPVTWFLTGMEKHSDAYKPEMIGNLGNFQGAMNHFMASFTTSSLQCAMNELSNHDHSRFLTRTNHKAGRVQNLGAQAASENVNKAVFREAVVIQMTWPGAPTIYYADEAGQCGFTDPDNRRTYPWGHEDQELIDFHRDIIHLHKENQALKTGSFMFLEGEDNLLCYSRFNRKQRFVVVVNNDEVIRNINLAVWYAGIPRNCTMTQIMYTNEQGYQTTPKQLQVVNGRVNITLPKTSAIILKQESE
ncbi:MAG: glycoside hydrolase family 13 protein [Lachnospiraceae bacterium]